MKISVKHKQISFRIKYKPKIWTLRKGILEKKTQENKYNWLGKVYQVLKGRNLRLTDIWSRFSFSNIYIDKNISEYLYNKAPFWSRPEIYKEYN